MTKTDTAGRWFSWLFELGSNEIVTQANEINT